MSQGIFANILNILLLILGAMALWAFAFGGFTLRVSGLEIDVNGFQRLILLIAVLFIIKLLISGGKERLFQAGEQISTIFESEKKTAIIIAGFAIVFVWVKISQYLSFNIHALDFSDFDYAISNTLKGDFMATPFWEQNYFGVHFVPILLFIVPFYALHDGPYVLLIMQAAIVAIGAYPFYKLCRHYFKEPFVAGLLMIAYLNYSYLIRGLIYDFHWEMIIPALFFFIFYYFEKKDYLKYFIFLFLALMAKEDVPLYTFFIGLYLLAVRKEWKPGIATMVLSAVWFVVAISIIKHINHGDLGYAGRWQAYGSNFVEIGFYFVSHPAELMRILFRPDIWLKLLHPLAFLPLLSPAVFLLALPSYFINVSSSLGGQASLSYYYSAPIIPFLFIAAALGIKRLYAWSNGSNKVLWAASMLLLLLSLNNSNLKTQKITDHHIIGYDAVSVVPEAASVIAQVDIMPHLPKRKEIRMLNFDSPRTDAEYILFDKTGNLWPLKPAEYEEVFRFYANSPEHSVLFEKDGYYIFRKAGI